MMNKYKWWQSAVFYQIYPRSFADGNGDGIGDFSGMIEKLTYLKNLGVDAIWLSPIFPSPNWDWGYDISDYKNTAPEYGNLEQFSIFIQKAHSMGLYVILDLVLNHTSDEHPWFIESRSSRNNPKSDWYIWHDPLANINPDNQFSPPNNWQSCFDGSAWTYSPERGQFYYHYFMKQQPDLNWSNPEVKNVMWNIVRFWLDLGVDGFRLDAIGTIFENPQLNPHTVPVDLAGLRYLSDTAQTEEQKKLVATYWQEMFKYQWGEPGTHDLMKELRAIVDEYPGDRVLVGEDDNIEYLGNGNDELHMVFNFPLMQTDRITPKHIHKNQADRLQRLNSLQTSGWGCNTLGNHDSPRVINRYGDGVNDDEIMRLNITLILTLPGTPFLYYGEEIGMRDFIITDPEHLHDTMATWYYTHLMNDLQRSKDEAIILAGHMSRDKNRTPMQWTNAVNAGFSPPEVKTWLPVNSDCRSGINVRDQEKLPTSIFNFYRQILKLRKNTPALQIGDYLPLQEYTTDYFSFLRCTSNQKILVILNYSPNTLTISSSTYPLVSTKFLFQQPQSCKRTSTEIIINPFGILIGDIP